MSTYDRIKALAMAMGLSTSSRERPASFRRKAYAGEKCKDCFKFKSSQCRTKNGELPPCSAFMKLL